jgi:hypothetical protein
MLVLRKRRLLVAVLAFIGSVPNLSAVIAEGRLYHGRMVQCLHGGLGLARETLGSTLVLKFTRSRYSRERFSLLSRLRSLIGYSKSFPTRFYLAMFQAK